MPATDIRVHYPSNRRILIIFGSVLVVLSLRMLVDTTTTLATHPDVPGWSFLLAGIPGLCTLMGAFSRKIRVSPAGVDYYFLTLHAATSWNNIAYIGPRQIGRIKLPALQLHTPTELIWTWYPRWREQHMQFSLVGYNLEALRRDFQRYVPDL